MSTAERKERERAMRQESIVGVAEQMFFSRGFDNVKMDDIARETELAKGTLYLYFQNKEELYFAIVLRGIRALNAMFREAVKGKRSGLDKTYAVGEAFYRFYKAHENHFRAFAYAKSARFDGDNGITAEIDRLSEENLGILADSIKAGIADGSIRPDADPMKTAIFLIESSQAMIMLPMGFDRALEPMGIDHEDLVYDSLGLMKRAIENTRKR